MNECFDISSITIVDLEMKSFNFEKSLICYRIWKDSYKDFLFY